MFFWTVPARLALGHFIPSHACHGWQHPGHVNGTGGTPGAVTFNDPALVARVIGDAMVNPFEMRDRGQSAGMCVRACAYGCVCVCVLASFICCNRFFYFVALQV